MIFDKQMQDLQNSIAKTMILNPKLQDLQDSIAKSMILQAGVVKAQSRFNH